MNDTCYICKFNKGVIYKDGKVLWNCSKNGEVDIDSCRDFVLNEDKILKYDIKK